ncbi:MAG: ABC transporter substrate-binding protein [Nitrospirota bacterium]|nr:ABC transporter substrate-binding protein [Nitrospirota bacterium]
MRPLGRVLRVFSSLLLVTLVSSCAKSPWNNPYPPDEVRQQVLYSSFHERPKHLDPAKAYSSNEYDFIAQIYEPAVQYHFLKRPYTLVPLTGEKVPTPTYYDTNGNALPGNAPADRIAFSVYEIKVRPGIRYQPHPALAQDASGRYLYHSLTPADLVDKHTLSDFAQTGTRELVAADYVHQIKRLAHPRIHSPILGLMAEYIVGLKDYAKQLAGEQERLVKEGKKSARLDLENTVISGVEVVDRYTYRIKIKGKYPQFVYWLAMPFFSPMPPEADRFYDQSGMAEKNIVLDWYPIGTGPFMLTVNNPNRQMVLAKNPNFYGETFPSEGMPGDAEEGLLANAGKTLPLVDKVVFSLEKESIPYWNKFLQGYYDASGVSSESFDQVVRVSGQGEVGLTDTMQTKGIRLATAVQTSTYYMGFNMLDSVVGGYSERARKLRQAISIAVDYEEFIAIFTNGRGISAQGPLPPGLFGYRDGESGINSYVYDWVNGAPQRKSIAEAKRLLAEAGYPNGVDAKTGAPLVLNFDVTAGGPDDKARLDWMRKQFAKIDVQLVIRNTDYNRFQDKMAKGNAQIFQWGWNADYPDPENFMFLLHGPQGKVKTGGENASNYDNPEFNRLFEQMKNMDNGPERQVIIDKMVEIARRDAPWLWGFNPKSFALYHEWYKNAKPNLMANNTLKYIRIDPATRAAKQKEWNRPVLWPVGVIALFLVIGTIPAVIAYIRKEHRPVKRNSPEGPTP